MNKELKKFKLQKKYDFIIILEYVLVLSICLFMIIYPLFQKGEVKTGFIDIIFTTVSIMLGTYFAVNFFTINYYLDDKYLYVKSVTTNTMLELKKIVEIKKCKKYFCSTITSSKTLLITYYPFGTAADKREFYVTVKDEEEFINKVKEKSKKLKIN